MAGTWRQRPWDVLAKCSRCSSRWLGSSARRTASSAARASRPIGAGGWALLLIPGGTFCLGTWQVQRKKWKEDLIRDLKLKCETQPQPLPDNLDDLSELEYRPVHVRGRFLHDRELYMGPRSLLVKGDNASQSSLISQGQMESSAGFLVVTPFRLADRDATILVNRGWVPARKKLPQARPSGQIEGDVDIVGVVRLDEKRPSFMMKNRPEANSWFYRDLQQMSRVTGALPVFLDATMDTGTQDGPIAGQTRISLRNEHFSYIVTWYSLSALTSYMWYRQFFRKGRIG